MGIGAIKIDDKGKKFKTFRSKHLTEEDLRHLTTYERDIGHISKHSY